MIYVSGPMSGVPEFNFPLFQHVAGTLRARGHVVVSPHEKGGEGETGDAAWDRYLRADIAAMMTCKQIVLLPGWPKSRGAKMELSIALGLGFEVFYWLDERLVSA